MSGYRQVHTQIWKDEWIIDLEPLERYLFIYLFTNELSSISGIFKLPIKVIENETGLDRDFIETSLAKFEQAKKVAYGDGVIWIVNMGKWHSNASPTTKKRVSADVEKIPECQVKTRYRYYSETGIYSIDTVSIPIHLIKSLNKDKDEDEDKDEYETNASEQRTNEQPATDKFDQIQRWLETNTGFPASGADDVNTIHELLTLDIIEDDIKSAISWLNGSAGKTCRRFSSLLNPIKVAYGRRVQGNNGFKKVSILDKMLEEIEEQERLEAESGHAKRSHQYSETC